MRLHKGRNQRIVVEPKFSTNNRERWRIGDLITLVLPHDVAPSTAQLRQSSPRISISPAGARSNNKVYASCTADCQRVRRLSLPYGQFGWSFGHVRSSCWHWNRPFIHPPKSMRVDMAQFCSARPLLPRGTASPAWHHAQRRTCSAAAEPRCNRFLFRTYLAPALLARRGGGRTAKVASASASASADFRAVNHASHSGQTERGRCSASSARSESTSWSLEPTVIAGWASGCSAESHVISCARARCAACVLALTEIDLPERTMRSVAVPFTRPPRLPVQTHRPLREPRRNSVKAYTPPCTNVKPVMRAK